METEGQGASGCVKCKKGTYKGNKQQLTCTLCPAGYYCDEEGMIATKECPKKHYCPEGSVTPKKCRALHSSREGADSCYAEVWVYGIILLCIIAAIAIAIIGIKVYIAYKRKQARDLDRQLEIEKLIPHSDGPVYSGL